MPRRTRASSRTPRPRPRAEPTPIPATPAPVTPAPAAPALPAAHELKANDFILGAPDFAKPSTEYSEFTVILMQAHKALKINLTAGIYPKLEEAKTYFMEQRLSDGTKISPREAEKLASFCRPVCAKKGGNKKIAHKG
jgi:hypothetical protein